MQGALRSASGGGHGLAGCEPLVTLGRPKRDAQRSRPRTVSNRRVALRRNPPARKGSTFAGLLEPRRRIGGTPSVVIATAHTLGTATRKVDDFVNSLGCESVVSRIRADNDPAVAPVREHALGHAAFPDVFINVTSVKARTDG